MTAGRLPPRTSAESDPAVPAAAAPAAAECMNSRRFIPCPLYSWKNQCSDNRPLLSCASFLTFCGRKGKQPRSQESGRSRSAYDRWTDARSAARTWKHPPCHGLPARDSITVVARMTWLLRRHRTTDGLELPISIRSAPSIEPARPRHLLRCVGLPTAGRGRFRFPCSGRRCRATCTAAGSSALRTPDTASRTSRKPEYSTRPTWNFRFAVFDLRFVEGCFAGARPDPPPPPPDL